MFTKNEHVSMLPMSTILIMSFIIVIGISLLVLFFNPFSMLFFNIFNPRFASSLAHNSFFCSKRVSAFYTKLALFWPYLWSRWWMTVEHLDKLSDARQKDYYANVNRSEETLWKLRPHIWVEVMNDEHLRFGVTEEIAQKIKDRNDLFAAMLDWALANQKSSHLLRFYLKYGTLPKQQMTALVDAVLTENKDHGIGVLADGLSEYVKRCGISKEMFLKLHGDETVSQDVKDLLEDSHDCYTQRIFTRNLRELKTYNEVERWILFCSKTEHIYAEAEQEMSVEQYDFFNGSGHNLEAAAIAHLLWHGNQAMAERIFRYEPKFGILNEQIDFVLDKHDYLRPLLKKVISEVEEELSLKLSEGDHLLTSEVNQLFDCPSAPKLVMDYLTKWTMPDELQMRMFELPNAKELIEFYVDLGQTGKDYVLTPEAKAKAVELGWMPADNKESDN